MSKELLFLTAFSLILLAGSCSATRFLMTYAAGDGERAGKMKDWVYTAERNSYRIAALSDDWQRVTIEGGDVAFYNSSNNLMLTVNSVCSKRDYKLQTLSDSLVVSLGKKQVRLRKNIDTGGGWGLYTEYEVSVGDERFFLATVVHKSLKCDYDFSYSAPPDAFGANQGKFIDFVSGFEEIWAR
ncbi:MAG: hypothetical protein OXC97_00555 [Candidatus Dadabacteria bacterium]|nr:hypothetical protein [Candidatus Dadabacteria bacterium]